MYKTGRHGPDMTRDSARAMLASNFDLLVHDLSCGCDSASPRRARGWLDLAEFTIDQAYQAWSDWWVGGGTRA